MSFGGGLFGAKPAGTTGTGLFGQAAGTSAQPQAANSQPNTGFGGFGGAQQQSTSLFGQQQQQKPSTGLFGNTGTTTAGANTGLFGNTAATNTTGGGLFGNAQANTNQQAGQTTGLTAGLFGNAQNTQNTNQQAGQTGGLFGNAQPNATQGAGSLFGSSTNTNTAPSTGLFGNAGATTQAGGATTGLFGNAAANTQGGSTGGLFGNAGAAQTGTAGGLFGNTNANQTGGLFGNANASTNTAGGLFGNAGASTNTGGGLFGNTGTNQGASGGLFGNAGGNANQAGTTGLFGSSTLGGQPSQQQSQLGLTTQAPPNITKSTKFNDLPEQMRNIMENIDTHIQGRIQISKELSQRKLGEEPIKGQVSIRELHKELIDITTVIREDAHTTKDLKLKVSQAVEDTIVATRIVEGYRNPQSGNTYLKDHASFPLEFFTRIADQMRDRLIWYRQTIEQIERKLSSSSHQGQTPQGLIATLQAQHATFLALASKTAALDQEVQKIKVYYTQLWRAKTGSVRDPFSDSSSHPDGQDFGRSTLGNSSMSMTLR